MRLISIWVVGLTVALSLPMPVCAADSPFAPPAEFAPDIHFWTRIYTEVGTDGGLLHDDRYLNVIYEVIKFPKDLSPKERARRVTAAKERYAAVLKKLAGGDPSNDDEVKRVRALWPENTSAIAFREAIERLRFQLGQANRFREGVVRAGAYEAHIAETLTNMGLPAELSALPHVESSFDPTARSHAGAAGLWQFIRSTGRRYMRIDADVDERMDPYLSTVAAARFLKFNYDLLGSWPLALTAYNHGPAGMRRAKDQLGTDDIVRISRTYQSRTFGFASRNYYIAFLAAVQVDRDPEKFFGPLQRHSEIKTRGVRMQSYVPVAALERTFGIDAQTLRMLNPALTSAVWRGERRVPRGFELRLPESLTDPALRLAELAPDQRFDEQKPEVLHRVKKGETLSTIASRSGVSVETLLQANGLRDSRRLRAGQVLRIPQPGDAQVRIAQADAAQKHAEAAEAKAKAKAEAAAESRAKAKTAAEAKAKAKAAAEAQARLAQAKAQEEAATKAAAAAKAATAAVAAQAPPPAPPEAEPPVTVAEVAETDKEIAEAENAEPVSETEAEAIGPQLIASEQSPLVADPSDYSIAEDSTIEIQAAETLGHIAEWLDLRASRLREINKLRFGQPVVTGRRLVVELTQVSVEEFERRRRAYHQGLQEEFFAANRIVGTEVHIVRRGESLWSIAQKNPGIPIWLLRQHNPDVDFAEVRPKTPIVLPAIEAMPASASAVTQ